MKKQENCFSVKEAADMLGVTDAYIIRMIQKNDLIGFRLHQRAWAVSLKSVVHNAQQYEAGHVGRPRRVS